MTNKLKVLVSGTGFAGQGHTDAFRNVGAEVVGIVGRTRAGQVCSNGVYLWKAIIRYKSGKQEIIAGDITLFK